MSNIKKRVLGGLFGPAFIDALQSFIAIGFAIVASLVTGLMLAESQATLAQNQGLLLLFPAAIGLRGNVFGPFASRLSTAMRAGTFSWNWSSDSLLGQNVSAVIGLSFVASVAVGFIAKLVAELTITTADVISLQSFITVSVVSAAIATFALLGITLLMATLSTRLNWDLDNVTAPVVTASGDLITFPALLLGVFLFNRTNLAIVVDVVGILVTLILGYLLFTTQHKVVKRITVESLPVLLTAGIVSLLAGIIIEGSSQSLGIYAVFLIALPGYLTVAGSLGGILANRLSTKFHLGLIKANPIPTGEARADIGLTFAIAVPIFGVLAVVSHLFASASSATTPGLGWILVVIATGGVAATVFVSILAYYGTIVVVRFGLDPDNHGIPMVSASLDLVGSATLMASLGLWGII